ncbi:HAMP domain-containing sensor histidine kinase [Cytophagaceae bacterium YF14B1]|uniref:histidine kinase n=1 Tax=Xanthocytophaga flava TaxID=3048013 RepID=A0AAE3QMK8_9BACT|nr:HAMP domain-containing sensor histidine kinase [Xanthocytophaga flavus]MDJ1479408.1 HAMP domain-containing sensor histidine kinase [Xanthocytophaga flavus]
MKELLSRIIVGKDPVVESRIAHTRILLTGQVAMVGIFISLFYIIRNLILQLNVSYHYHAILLSLMILVVVLNRKGHHLAAKILFLTTTNFLIFLFSSTASYYTGSFIYFIPIFLAAFVLFGYEERTKAIFFFLLTLFLFILAHLIDLHLVPQVTLSTRKMFESFIVNFFTASFLTMLLINFLIRENYYYTKELIQNEEQLLEKNTQLIKINQELDQFVYSTSHDLRSPLSTILGLLQVMELEKEKENAGYYIDLIRNRIHALDHVIGEILDYAWNQKTGIQQDSINLHALLTEILTNFLQDEKTQKLSIEIEVPPTLEIISDRRRLKIILLNLLSNAIRYHKYDQSKPFIRVSSTIHQNQLEICVEDNGPGIHPDHQEKIFEMFYRASDKTTGSGLGLYIVKETTEKIGGTIHLRSEYGKGSSFIIQLPIVQ